MTRCFVSSSWLVVSALALSGGAHAQDRLGTEFQVNSYTPNTQWFPSVAAETNGDFVVVWYGSGQDGDSYGVFLFDFRGVTLTAGVVDTGGCSRCSAPAIEGYLAGEV